jgi:hypothetical protein
MKKVVSKKDIEKEVKNNESVLINEGYWEDFKYYAAKLTKRYKADGKVFGKSKVDAAAKAKIEAILNKAGNDVIKKLDDFIKQTNPEFPNNRKGDEFLATVLHIAQIYESLVNATKIPKGQTGRLEVDAANKIIDDLREYTKKALDTDLYAVYSGLDEDAEMELGENEMLNELEASDVRSNLASRGGTGSQFGSTRMDTLKSNKLPLLLAGLGSSLGGLSWLTTTDFFKDLFTTKSSIKEIIDSLRETLNYNAIRPGEGLTQIMNRTQGLNLSPQSSPEEFLQGVAKIGGGDLRRGIDLLSTEGGIFTNPDAAKGVIENIARNPHGHGDTLGQIFKGTWAGTGANAGDLLVTKPGGILFNIIVSAIKKQAIKTTTTTSAAYFAAKGLGSVLGPIGVGLIGAGALVKLFRMKGQRQSRAATLNSLYQMMKNVQPTKDNVNILALPPGPSSQKQIGGGSQRQLGQGQPEPEVTISGGGKQKPKFDSSKLDAQDVEAEPVEPENAPETQRQLGAGAKRLGTGQTETKPTGQEQPKTTPKKPYTQLNNTLTNFFKNLLDIRRQDQENLQEEFEAVKALRTPENKLMMNNFIVSISKLRSLAKFISKLGKTDTKNQQLNDLLQKLVQNKAHLTIIGISSLLEKYRDNTDMINKFVQIYLNNIKNNKFQNLQSIIDSQSEQINEDKKPKGAGGKLNPETFLKEFNQNFKIYLKNLYQLFELVNKLRNTEQKATTEEQPLEEGKKKKNKYSKKASEFIGKEISHLKKDKGYPQDRAVAAAINVAKEKGMKVGSKKPKAKTK